MTSQPTGVPSPNNLLGVFCIYDIKAESYLPPFTAMNDAMALRMVATAANDESSTFHQHAEDYSLWRIGSFDQNSGMIEPDVGNCLAKAFDLLKNKADL